MKLSCALLLDLPTERNSGFNRHFPQMPPKKRATLKKQLAASEALRAASEAQNAALRAASEAQIAELRATIATLSVSGTATGTTKATPFRSLVAALCASPQVTVCSPSKKGHLGPLEQRVLPHFANFDVRSVPVTPTLVPLSAAKSLIAWQSDSNDLLDEKKS